MVLRIVMPRLRKERKFLAGRTAIASPPITTMSKRRSKTLELSRLPFLGYLLMPIQQ